MAQASVLFSIHPTFREVINISQFVSLHHPLVQLLIYHQSTKCDTSIHKKAKVLLYHKHLDSFVLPTNVQNLGLNTLQMGRHVGEDHSPRHSCQAQRHPHDPICKRHGEGVRRALGAGREGE